VRQPQRESSSVAAGPSHVLDSAASVCDDSERHFGDIREERVEFRRLLEDEEFGRLDRMRVPDTGEIGLYQPAPRSPLDL
jgi:hypothetical protein